MMKLIEYKNSNDDAMIIVINEENDTAESMSKIEYERRQAEQEAQQVEHLTEKPTSGE